MQSLHSLAFAGIMIFLICFVMSGLLSVLWNRHIGFDNIDTYLMLIDWQNSKILCWSWSPVKVWIGTTVSPVTGLATVLPSSESPKLVLFWTKFFYAPDPRGSLGPKLFEGCPVSQCSSTADQRQLSSSSAVIFHAFDIDLNNLPAGPRRSGQHYIFHIGESAAHLGGRVPETPPGFFDMVQSYRLDSDILGHYTYSVPLEKEPRNFALGKTKLAAWFVSHCQTHGGREVYVKELQKFIPIDVYGACGSLQCPRSVDAHCNARLRKDYKFYLAFENSICVDYVTEKFTNALEAALVPVVFGAGNMSIFPPRSYIHVDDFPSAQALAEHLKYLDRNDTAYNEYMKWRFDERLVQSHGRFSTKRSGWCQLCEKLHDPMHRGRGYHSAKEWFIGGGHCRERQDGFAWTSPV